MNGIKNYFVNSNLLSASTDTIRNTVGGYWKIDSTGDNMSLSFMPVGDGSAVDDTGRSIDQNFISRVITDSVLSTTSSADLVIPSIKIPIRLVGDENAVFEDTQWRAILMGETFGSSSYQGIYNSSTFTNLNFNYEMPYDPIYIKKNDYSGLTNYTTAQFKYDYNYYLKTFQDSMGALNNFLLTPNYYDLITYNLGLQDQQSSIISSYIGSSLDAEYPTEVFTSVLTNYPPAYDIDSSDLAPSDSSTYTFKDKRQNTEAYLTAAFGRSADASSAMDSLEGYSSLSSNLFFNKKTQQTLFEHSLEYKELMPYCINLTLPFKTGEQSTFFDMIEDAGFENLLLNHIKEQFVDKTESPGSAAYTTFTTKIETPANSSVIAETTRNSSNDYRAIDLYEIILDTIMASNQDTPSNFNIPGGQEAERQKIINDSGIYRYCHSVPALKMLENINSFLETDAVFAEGITQLEDFLNLAQHDRYNEVVAYRIEKQELNSDLKQNFYVSKDQSSLRSTSNRDGFTIYDTQVIYGREYTYTAYAYVLAYGYTYKYEDLVISKQIATKQIEYADFLADLVSVYGLDVTDQAIVAESAHSQAYCIEFYNPSTGETSERIVYNDGSQYLSDLVIETEYVDWLWRSDYGNPILVSELTAEDIADFEAGPFGAGDYVGMIDDYITTTSQTVEGLATNQLFTNAQLASYDKFLADLNITIEPTIKLIEIPIFTKNVTVTDHMPVPLGAQSFQRMDNSNIIGFLLTQDMFVPAPRPEKIISSGDLALTDFNYLESNDLIREDNVPFASRSKTAHIEIFRTTKKPKSMTDFKMSDLVEARSMLSPNQDYLLSNMIYEDKIPTNKKYYYTFRAVSENITIGPQTSIYEVELIDDGGYKYIVTKEIIESDFEQEEPVEVSTQLKKLLQIVPNINQIKFDTSAVDYSQIASEQLSNITVGIKEETIFDKTFKIRLTSRKTGKRIDLNVTYKLTDM